MTPKEKAIELVGEYMMVDIHDEDHFIARQHRAKQCALIMVEEIIPIVEGYEEALGADQTSDYAEYWKEVKQEIKNL